MGLMLGYVRDKTFVVTDAVRLPVEGTETRVNAQDDANEYIVTYLERSRQAGQMENAVGWYHSHPGYGCWLSGIDVGTQFNQQVRFDLSILKKMLISEALLLKLKSSSLLIEMR